MARQSITRDAQRGAEQAAAGAARNPLVRLAARIGYAAIGIVYILVGVLALRVAFGPGGDAPDQSTALQQILGAPFGRAMLGLIAFGLFGYLIWRIIEAVLDLRGKGSDPNGLGARAGYVASGLAYGVLGIEAGRLALGMGGGGGGGQQEWTARLMELPLGRWLVVAVALCVAGTAVYQLYKGATRKFREELLYGQMSEAERKVIDPIGVVGYIAHGIVLGLAALFLALAALRFDPQQARGLGGALEELAAAPFGPLLLGLVAAGLSAYGIYKLAQARYYVALAR